VTPLAGPVFPEWYWGPIFFAVVYGPVFAAAAFGADVAVRRWVRPLSWPQRRWLWAAVIGGGVMLIVVVGAVRENVHFNGEASAAAAAIDFQPYEPKPLPRPFTEEHVVADDNWTGPALISRYGAGLGAYATAFQQRPVGELSLQEGHCSVTKLAGTGTNFFDGPCRELRSPKGIPVFIGVSETIVDGGDAFALLGGTLLRFEVTQVADRDVLAYVDSLQPVDKDDIDFKRG
jgi:hypothetical protein